MWLKTIALVCLALISTCWAVIIHESQAYPEPVRRIRGRIVAGSESLRMNVNVAAFNHPEVWSDDSLTPEQKRKKQRKIAATWTDEDGKFALKELDPGRYEVEFSKGNGGWNVLSLFIRVDPNGKSDDLCIQLGIEGSEHESSARPCNP
jgi:hypothetical protein